MVQPAVLKLVLGVGLMLTILVGVASGCGDGDGSPEPTSSAGTTVPNGDGDSTADGQPTDVPTEPQTFRTPVPPDPDDAEAIESALNAVIAALDAGDRNALRDLAADRLGADMDENSEDTDELLACWPDAMLADPALGAISVNDEQARVRVNFILTRNETEEISDRLWEFEWDGSSWRLKRLPNCPPS